MSPKGVILFAIATALAMSAHARPYPDKVGVCYIFKGNNVLEMDTCIISIRDGAGGTSTSLQLNDKRYNIEGSETEKSTNRYEYEYTVNGAAAQSYYRNASFYDVANPEELFEIEEPALYCYKTKTLNICHN